MKIRILLLLVVLSFGVKAQPGCPSLLPSTHILGPDSIENHFDQTFRSLAVNPLNPNHVIVGTEGNGVFISRDGGLHWQWKRDGFKHLTTSYAETWTTVFDAKDTSVLYCATTGSPGPTQGNGPSAEAGVYTSRNNGQTWNQRNCGLPASSSTAIWCNKDSTNNLVVGIAGGAPSFTNPTKPFYDGGIYYSLDGAANWMKANTPVNVDSIGFWKFVKIGDTLVTYGLSGDLNKAVGFLKSYDNGRNWQRFAAPLANKPIVDFTVAPDGLTIVAMVRDSNAVYTSSNGGYSWTRISISLNGLLEFHPQSADTIFFTAQNEMYKSKNGLKTGNLLSPDYKLVGAFTHWIEKIAFALSNPNIMYVSTRGLRVYKSTDGGETFSLMVKLREVMADSMYITHDSLTLAEDTLNSVLNGDTSFIQLTSNTTWVVNNPTGWITVTPMNGNGNQLLSVMTSQNTGSERTVTLTVTAGTKSKTIFVKQESVPAILTLDEDSLNASHLGDTSSIQLTCNTGWTVNNPISWITVAPMSGTGNQLLSIRTTKNTGSVRTAMLSINAGSIAKTIYVKQETETPYLTLGKDTLLNASDGDTSTLQLTSNTMWTVNNLASWINVNPANGTGNQSLTIITAKNTGPFRAANVTINAGSMSKTVYVSQEMNIPYLILSEDTIINSAEGDTSFVTLTTNTGWNLGTSAGWVAVTPLSGNGNQTLSIIAGANSGPTRVATITINAGTITKTIFVKQEEIFVPHLILDTDTVKSPAAGNTTTVHVTSNTSWTVSHAAGWVTISPMSGTGNATLSCVVSANPSNIVRKAEIRVTTGSTASTGIFYVHQEALSTGLESLSGSEKFTLFPNPTAGKLTFKSFMSMDSEVDVFDLNGKAVDHFSVKDEGEITLDYTTLNNGLYIVHIRNLQGVSTQKFIVNK